MCKASWTDRSRNYGLLLFEFLLPAIQVRALTDHIPGCSSIIFIILQIIIFCLAIGGDPTGLNIAVVNEDLGAVPPSAFNISTADWCNTVGNQSHCFLSRAYLNQLDTKTVTVRTVSGSILKAWPFTMTAHSRPAHIGCILGCWGKPGAERQGMGCPPLCWQLHNRHIPWRGARA
jgi:hypothetical protein